ncbi:PAAR domain-containing protein [Xenorhabdus sp. PB62.4]|uniref:PAAR domain-containing protein n=1 Tax=Xenorhabdus sp. PB62.4 TaxID=1851573 RepID=UPI001657044C|nr:PAAR domain-containing protein [Xenorhabdus sp. PB62.4]
MSLLVDGGDCRNQPLRRKRLSYHCSKEDGIRQMAQGSDSVYINGLPASRVGDKPTQ